MFILITGKLPFFGEFEADLFRKIQKAKFDFPKETSTEARNVIKKIFQVESNQRVTAEEVRITFDIPIVVTRVVVTAWTRQY